MPYKIHYLKKHRCYVVYNARTGQVHASCSTAANAEKQRRLLEGVERGTLKSRRKRKRR